MDKRSYRTAGSQRLRTRPAPAHDDDLWRRHGAIAGRCATGRSYAPFRMPLCQALLRCWLTSRGCDNCAGAQAAAGRMQAGAHPTRAGSLRLLRADRGWGYICHACKQRPSDGNRLGCACLALSQKWQLAAPLRPCRVWPGAVIVQAGGAVCAASLADAGERARRAARAQKFRDNRRAALQASAADAAHAAEAAPAAAAPAAPPAPAPGAVLPVAVVHAVAPPPAAPAAAPPAPAPGAAESATAAAMQALGAAFAEARTLEEQQAVAGLFEAYIRTFRLQAARRAATPDSGTGGAGRGATPRAAPDHPAVARATVQPVASPPAAGGAPATPPPVCMPLSGLHAAPADTTVRRRA